MKLRNLLLSLFLLATIVVTISCEPDKMLNDINVVSDSGNENNQEKPRDPED
ncbi:hypothetical protein [Leeuwenhoekiella marinoflava]|uniref:Uncharacterized protein n=2 Tax=Leeuwenhoekiella marinoflava TaxID=988 RepID=A0A4Q0PL39_9FLAO|nr:hypothetical protein [Leeuwenhoekiella marinoflava]RXG29179.1 hypothetical protein DSL99_2117 [Leeuwenhoekiella marinoflava]SHF34204.1 hypothetical protein SAMN02745246_02254 [Leeuwenhoekiella marinoflava DSM 3653]